MSKTNSLPRAAGGIRISELAGRKKDGPAGKRLHSDDNQRDKLYSLAEEFHLVLDEADIFEEPDTSGALPLSRRPKLLAAVERVESGELKAIIFAYRDRSDRSIAVMTEVVERIDAVPGAVLIAGGSVLTHKTADAWARSVLESFANEMPSRYARDKVRDAHIDAIGAGIPCYQPVPGYAKDADGRFIVVPELVPVIREAFAMRDRRESINAIRRYLTDHGVTSTRRGHEGRPLSYAGVESMLRSPSYVGLVMFGDLAYRGEGVDPADDMVEPVVAHEAIIEADLWRRIRERKSARGRQAKSDRLLARQGVLVCKSCGARMTATSNRGYAFYRCQHNASPNCPARATVSAERVERQVIDTLRAQRELMKLEGTASADLGEQLRTEARQAKALLEDAIEAFGGDDLGSAKRRIAELKRAWQEAEAEADRHDRTDGARAALRRLDDWDDLTLDGRRGIIRACVESITVASAKGATLSGRKWDSERAKVRLFTDDSAVPAQLVGQR